MEEVQVVKYDHTYLINKLNTAREAFEEAREDLKHWIAVAEAEGIAKTAISEASGISRVTINKWIAAGEVRVNRDEKE